MTDKLYDLTFYTSRVDFEACSPTRQRCGVPEPEAADEIRLFRSVYRATMSRNNGRMIVVIDPHFREDLMTQQPKDWRATLQAERASRVTLSPGPDHNAVAWNPETDIPAGNRPDSWEEHEAEIEAARALAREHNAALDREKAGSIEAAVYRAISPQRQEGETYTEYLGRPLTFRRVSLEFFDFDTTTAELEAWLDVVQQANTFDPAEVFVIRNRAAFEAKYAARLKRPYTPSMLLRRQRRIRRLA